MSEENKLHVLYCSLSVYFYFLLFSASYYLHIPTIASEAHSEGARIELQSTIRARYGSG